MDDKKKKEQSMIPSAVRGYIEGMKGFLGRSGESLTHQNQSSKPSSETGDSDNSPSGEGENADSGKSGIASVIKMLADGYDRFKKSAQNSSLSDTETWSSSNGADVKVGADSSSGALPSYHTYDKEQEDLNRRRNDLQKSYSQNKYDLSTKEGRENYRRDTMFTGFSSWRGQRTPASLLRQSDRELKKGNKAMAQHWIDVHDELYGNKRRDAAFKLESDLINEEQQRLDRRRKLDAAMIVEQRQQDNWDKEFEAREKQKQFENDLRAANLAESRNRYEQEKRDEREREDREIERRTAEQKAEAEARAKSETQKVEEREMASLLKQYQGENDASNKAIESLQKRRDEMFDNLINMKDSKSPETIAEYEAELRNLDEKIRLAEDKASITREDLQNFRFLQDQGLSASDIRKRMAEIERRRREQQKQNEKPKQ